MHYHNRARAFKGTNGNNVPRSRRQTRSRAMQLVRIRQSEFHEKYGTSFITFSVFLPFIEIAARLPSFPPFFLRGRDEENQRQGCLCLSNPIRGAFSSSCAMNQDFLEYFSEYPTVSHLMETNFCRGKIREIFFNRIFSHNLASALINTAYVIFIYKYIENKRFLMPLCEIRLSENEPDFARYSRAGINFIN